MTNDKNYTIQRIEDRNSVKFSINAKGQWAGELKIYAQTIGEAYDKAISKAEEMAELIRGKNGSE